MEEANLIQDTTASPGSDSLEDELGLLQDIDLLEEFIEDLDEFGFTTRDDVHMALVQATQAEGTRAADEVISRLETMIATFDDFEAASREDILRKMVAYENDAEAFKNGEISNDDYDPE